MAMMHAQYVRRLSLSLVAYAALLFASLGLLQGPAASAPQALRIVLAVMPMFPAASVLIACMDRFRALDELQRRILAEGLSFAVGATAIITFSYSFLQNATGAPNLSWFWIWPILALTTCLGSAFARRRYS